jgi:hypothetical protein
MEVTWMVLVLASSAPTTVTRRAANFCAIFWSLNA